MMAKRSARTLPARYLFSEGIEPWKPKDVKKIGAAESSSALLSGMAVRLCSEACGSMTAITSNSAASIMKKKKRLPPSTALALMTMKAPKTRVKRPM